MIQDGTQQEGETWKDTLKKRGGTPLDFKNLNSVVDKSREYGTFEKAFVKITASEIETLNKIGTLTCLPEEVEPKMIALAEKIQGVAQKVIRREHDCVEAAAFVHREIGAIPSKMAMEEQPVFG